jgi:hypothetical protein
MAKCAALLRYVRRIITPATLNAATCGPAWGILASARALEPINSREARSLRDGLANVLAGDLSRSRDLNIEQARVLSILNNLVWVDEHEDPDSWPTLDCVLRGAGVVQ